MDELLENAEVTAEAESVDKQETVARNENEEQTEIAEEAETEKGKANQQECKEKEGRLSRTLIVFALATFLLVFCGYCGVHMQQSTCSHKNKIRIGESVVGSCTQEGWTAEYRCSDCGEIFPPVSAGFHHSYNSEGVCTICGKKQIITYSGSSGSTDTYSTVSESDSGYFYALSAAKQLVKGKLKSPSTAKFPSTVFSSAYTVKRSGTKWKVSGYVDAQNSFGATVRTYWTATFKMNSSYEPYDGSVTTW